MGGSGGGGAYRLNPSDLKRIQEEAQARLQRSEVDAAVNSMLQHELVELNDRDVDAANQRLDEIEDALRDLVDEFDRLVFGGSVAKHTYVDGLSDTDCLVVLSQTLVGERSPAEMRERLREVLEARLNMGEVENIEVGWMAVTVNYRDGTMIQLLPAVQRGDVQEISSATGNNWAPINPKEFASHLTEVNQAQAGSVIPAIKLAKAIAAAQLPEPIRPHGYHMEALAVAAFEHYQGPRTPKAMLEHLFNSAAGNVTRPISDVTGQSRVIDENLGPEGSAERQQLSRELTRISQRMMRAQNEAEWKRLLGTNAP
jgi:hypothetical protein